MKITKKDAFNIPNIMGYFRIALIPVFVWRFLTAQTRFDYYIAAGIVLLSGFTDLFDGKIARKYNMITELGKALDPIADKLTQGIIALCLMIKVQHMWIIFVILAIKETFMGVCNIIAMKRNGKKLDGAMWFGKTCTFVLDVSLVIIIAFFAQLAQCQWILNALIALDAGFLTLSFVMYIPVFAKIMRKEG